MKKMICSLLCSGLMFLFLLHTLSSALNSQTNENDTETPIPASIIKDAAYYTEEGKPLNQYDIVTSVTEDGVQVYGFFAKDGNIIASMLENEKIASSLLIQMEECIHLKKTRMVILIFRM